jgi:hypothetical protein
LLQLQQSPPTALERSYVEGRCGLPGIATFEGDRMNVLDKLIKELKTERLVYVKEDALDTSESDYFYGVEQGLDKAIEMLEKERATLSDGPSPPLDIHYTDNEENVK